MAELLDDEEKVRRTRGSASVIRGTFTLRFGREVIRGSTLPEAVLEMCAREDTDAASDDEGGKTIAEAATSPAAGKARSACAEAAQEKDGKGAKPRVPSEGDSLPAGTGELPAEGSEFVRLIDRRVSLPAAWERLVRASDLKISQRALEKLSELDYKAAHGPGHGPQFELDVTPQGQNELPA